MAAAPHVVGERAPLGQLSSQPVERRGPRGSRTGASLVPTAPAPVPALLNAYHATARASLRTCGSRATSTGMVRVALAWETHRSKRTQLHRTPVMLPTATFQNDPFMVRSAGCGRSLEVSVVVQHDKTCRLCGRRHHQIRFGWAVLDTASQLVQSNSPCHDYPG